jgi:hypothetical protein
MWTTTNCRLGDSDRDVQEIAEKSRASSGARALVKGMVKFLVVVVVAHGPMGRAEAGVITIALTAEVELVDDPGGFLGGAIGVGDTIQGVYRYESTTPDTNPLPTVGDYRHTTPPFGITLQVGGLVFRTDPSNIDFLVEIANDHLGDPRDNYLLRSYNNLFDVSVPTPSPELPVTNHISWQLDDPTATAISSTELPTTPPVLADWQSIFGLDILSENSLGEYFLIRGRVTSAALVPEPSTWLLLCTGLGGLLGYAWRYQRA